MIAKLKFYLSISNINERRNGSIASAENWWFCSSETSSPLDEPSILAILKMMKSPSGCSGRKLKEWELLSFFVIVV